MLYTSLLLIASILLIIVLSSYYKLSTFYVLLLIAVGLGLVSGLNGKELGDALRTGFGDTMGKVGLIVILGSTLGLLLDKSNATISLTNYFLEKTGEGKTPLAIMLVGFVVGLPILCHAGFIVLIGLTLSLSRKIPSQTLQLVLCLGTSLFCVHCLVPPHPGITAAAGTLGVDMGKAILLGIVVALPATIVAYFWASYVGKKYNHELLSELEGQNHVDLPVAADVPLASASFLPVLIPILLIAIKSVFTIFPHLLGANVIGLFNMMGEPVIALLIGIVLTLPLFKRLNFLLFTQICEESIMKAGPIIGVIAAGGALGEIIKTLQIDKVYGSVLSSGGLGLLIPFGLTVIFKVAQGSSTVAVISATTICAPLLQSLGLDSEWGKLLTLSAIGAGSMFVSHANDAYFLVVSKFGNLNISLMLRTYTPATALMGLASLLCVYIVKWWIGV